MTSNQDARERFSEIIRDFDTAMLVTRAGGERMHARPMAVAAVNADGDVYFATSIEAPKVAEIEADAQVTVTFQSQSRFAALSGTANVVRDRALVERLWSEPWRVWWPCGKDDPSLALIRVEAEAGEYWDNAGVQGVKYTLRAVKAYARAEKPTIDVDQHGKTKL